jgi:hypothetical protein
MARHPHIPFIVIVQTPVYGTLSWGTFDTREEAEAFIAGGLNDHIYATYGSLSQAGMVVWAQPLYDPVFDNSGGE